MKLLIAVLNIMAGSIFKWAIAEYNTSMGILYITVIQSQLITNLFIILLVLGRHIPPGTMSTTFQIEQKSETFISFIKSINFSMVTENGDNFGKSLSDVVKAVNN